MTTRRFSLPTATASDAITAHPSRESWPPTPQERFAALQERLSHALAADRVRVPGRSVVVVSSRALDKWHEPPALIKALEERLLGIVLGLGDPGLSVVYVTSTPIDEEVVGYYLGQLPADLRDRLGRRGKRDRIDKCGLGACPRTPRTMKLSRVLGRWRVGEPGV